MHQYSDRRHQRPKGLISKPALALWQTLIPTREYEETCNKAGAMMRGIEMAERGLD